MQERHIVVEGGSSYCEGCTGLWQRGVGRYKHQTLFSESDNALPRKLIDSCGVVLVLSASATLAQYWASIGRNFVLTGRGGGGGYATYDSMYHIMSYIQIFL